MKTVAWVLNLDAELELAQPNRSDPSTRLRAQTEFHGKRFLEGITQSTSAEEIRYSQISDKPTRPTASYPDPNHGCAIKGPIVRVFNLGLLHQRIPP